MNWILIGLSLICALSCLAVMINVHEHEPLLGSLMLVIGLLYTVVFLMDLSRALDIYDFKWLHLVLFRCFLLGGLWYIIYESRRRYK